MREFLIPLLRLLVLKLLLVSAPDALACTVQSSATAQLGSHGSIAMGNSERTTVTASGLSCPTVIQLLSVNKMAVKLSSSQPYLVGPNNAHIPFSIATTSDGPNIMTGNIVELSTTTFLSILVPVQSRSQFFIKTPATLNLPDGNYTATVTVNWYYYICTTAAVVCLSVSESNSDFGTGPGGWGTPKTSTMELSLTVKRDCTITADPVSFGSSPLPELLPTVSQSIAVLCSPGQAYNVALSNGENSVGSPRLMKSGSNYLAYDIFTDTQAATRWGPTGTERWSSATASQNPNNHNGSATQYFNYIAKILPNDPHNTSVSEGVYRDTLRVSLEY